jgi:hypothetical protein
MKFERRSPELPRLVLRRLCSHEPTGLANPYTRGRRCVA